MTDKGSQTVLHDGFTHLDDQGQARMVDVGHKAATHRQAVAVSTIYLGPKVFQLLLSGGLPKGDALATARLAAIMAVKQTPHLIPLCHPRLAAIMAVKQTPHLIPLCHPINLTAVEVTFHPEPGDYRLTVEVLVRTRAQTGVEMEALTGAAVAALTIYDMCKAVDKGMVIERILLRQKSGGKSGDYHFQAAAPEDNSH